MGRRLARVTSRTMLGHVRHVIPVAPGAASGTVAEVYRQMAEDFGVLAPPVLLHSPAPVALRACWLMLRETLLAPGLVGREAREVVAAAVSLGNQCPYCVEVHGATTVGLVGGAGPGLLGGAGLEGITDPDLRALARWAYHSGARAAADRVPPPFSVAHAPELIGVAVTFHYLNRMVTVFLQESPLPRVPSGLRAGVRRAAARIMGSLARTAPPPGRSLGLLPPAPLPPDLSWAVGQPHIAAALARAGDAVEGAGAQALPGPARDLVLACLADPPAEGPGFGRQLDTVLARLHPEERPAARLALLTAIAPYRVADSVVTRCRESGADDARLIGLTSWASLAAARRIGGGLHDDVTRAAGDRTSPAGDS